MPSQILNLKVDSLGKEQAFLAYHIRELIAPATLGCREDNRGQEQRPGRPIQGVYLALV
jgi:hypothetical protein